MIQLLLLTVFLLSSVTIPAGATQVSFDVSITGGSFSSTESIVIE